RTLKKSDRQRWSMVYSAQNTGMIEAATMTACPTHNEKLLDKWHEMASVWLDNQIEEARKFAIDTFIEQAMNAFSVVQERDTGTATEARFWIFEKTHYVPLMKSNIITMRGNAMDYACGKSGASITERQKLTAYAKSRAEEAVAASPFAKIENQLEPGFLNLADGVLEIENLKLHPHSPRWKFSAVNDKIKWESVIDSPEPAAWNAYLEQSLGRNQAREMWKFIYVCLAVFPRPQI